MSTDSFSTLTMPDGAELAFEVIGEGNGCPIVLIGGMTSIRGDWERLSSRLAKDRRVLLFDHRGIGDSKLSPGKGENITIDLMARDLLEIIRTVGWKEFAICGFSMGGVIAQQLLVLPYHPTEAEQLPFRVTHVLLTGTLCSVLRDKRYRFLIDRSTPSHPRTQAEKREIARVMIASTFDPSWLSDAANSARFNWWLDRMTIKRPTSTILRQAHALGRFSFKTLLQNLSPEIEILVIHGQLDQVVPFACGEEILATLPHAQAVKVGTERGQVPSLAFGHHWFEYFDIEVWSGVINQFVDSQGGRQGAAKL